MHQLNQLIRELAKIPPKFECDTDSDSLDEHTFVDVQECILLIIQLKDSF